MPIGAVNHAVTPVQTIIESVKIASAPGRPTAISGASMPVNRIVESPATASTCVGTTAPLQSAPKIHGTMSGASTMRRASSG